MMYRLVGIDGWVLVRNEDGWSCYEIDPESKEKYGHGWGSLREWHKLRATFDKDRYVCPVLPDEVPAEIGAKLIAMSKSMSDFGRAV